jgi:hypothetical protein
MSKTNADICPLCSGTKFTWGIARPTFGFAPAESFVENLKIIRAQNLRARLCNERGNVQLFAKE